MCSNFCYYTPTLTLFHIHLGLISRWLRFFLMKTSQWKACTLPKFYLISHALNAFSDAKSTGTGTFEKAIAFLSKKIDQSQKYSFYYQQTWNKRTGTFIIKMNNFKTEGLKKRFTRFLKSGFLHSKSQSRSLIHALKYFHHEFAEIYAKMCGPAYVA
jgi:hypothetical protein